MSVDVWYHGSVLQANGPAILVSSCMHHPDCRTRHPQQARSFLRVKLNGRWYELRHVRPESYTVVDKTLPVLTLAELAAAMGATSPNGRAASRTISRAPDEEGRR